MLVSAASDGASAGQSGARRVEWQDRETGNASDISGCYRIDGLALWMLAKLETKERIKDKI